MKTHNRLDTYLEAFNTRLKQLALARGVAALCVITLVITGLGAYLGIRTGFADGVINTARLLLLFGAAAVLVLLVVLPRRRIDQEPAREVEQRTPAFAGRVETYLGMQDPDNALRSLLAEDAADVARRFPVERTRHSVDRRPSVPWGSCPRSRSGKRFNERALTL